MAAGDLTITYVDTAGLTQVLVANRFQVNMNAEGVFFSDPTPTYYFQPWSRVLRITSDEPLVTLFP